MQFHLPSASILLLLLSTLATAAPPPLHIRLKRALTFRQYNDMSISAGPAGNAEAEALAVWTAGIDLSDLAAVAAADLAILNVERDNAENAETEAFNPAIQAASGAAAEALQCGKIKNKVLKLTGLAQIRRINLAQAQAASKDTASIQAALADTKKKLATNIAIDKGSAGQECQAVDFVGQTGV
ncbi:hypothetical protein B9Z19DRAFT_1124364 [Tuber borchii]|uniref:Small secreted protein n=1 Tax=Tuber borchii TaxID=42251 RepID=A0A2T6ZWS1_TUBBO|nr:hypothetical protein B9Z19DRAFT_1124364 [Tuber borchii]